MRSRNDQFDAIVIGGGIYGIMVALEASLRDLNVALVERGDWGGGTTSNWLRIIHGGLRYLQNLDLPRFFESVRERHWFLKNFPHLVRPLPCVMPLNETNSYSPTLMKAALAVNDTLSFRRNRGLPLSHHIPPGEILTKARVQEVLPFVDGRALRGGVCWYDAIVPEPDRLLLELLQRATSNGVTALNRTDAVELLTNEGIVSGVKVRGGRDGKTRNLHAPVVINACGHWSTELVKRFAAELIRPPGNSWAWNILFDIPNHSRFTGVVKAQRRDAQTFLVLPWRKQMLVGTGHAAKPAGSEDVPVPRHLVRRFIDDVNEAMPALDLSESRIAHVFAGHLPVVADGSVELTRRPYVFDHANSGAKGLVTVWGIKYTTARAVADALINRIFPSGRRTESSLTE